MSEEFLLFIKRCRENLDQLRGTLQFVSSVITLTMIERLFVPHFNQSINNQNKKGTFTSNHKIFKSP